MKDDVVAPFADGSQWESKGEKTITVIDPSNGRHHLSTISAGCEVDADSAVAEWCGKSPHIVFDDGVDLDRASECIAKFLLLNQDQVWSVGSRLLTRALSGRGYRIEAQTFNGDIEAVQILGDKPSSASDPRGRGVSMVLEADRPWSRCRATRVGAERWPRAGRWWLPLRPGVVQPQYGDSQALPARQAADGFETESAVQKTSFSPPRKMLRVRASTDRGR